LVEKVTRASSFRRPPSGQSKDLAKFALGLCKRAPSLSALARLHNCSSCAIMQQTCIACFPSLRCGGITLGSSGTGSGSGVAELGGGGETGDFKPPWTGLASAQAPPTKPRELTPAAPHPVPQSSSNSNCAGRFFCVIGATGRSCNGLAKNHPHRGHSLDEQFTTGLGGEERFYP